MVLSTNRPISPRSHHSLEMWVRARCQNLSQKYLVDFQLDFPAGLEDVPYSHALLATIDNALEKAAGLSLADTSIEISGFLTHRGLEIEVVTDQEPADDVVMGAFHREASIVHNGFTLTSYRARCPQGGTAWIIVQSDFQRLRMVA